jgi:hypothetical protein
MTTVTSGNSFNTNCDVVDYSTAHILSYLVVCLNDQCSQFHYYLRLFRENIYSLRSLQRKYSCGFKSGLFAGQFCPHAKRSGNRFEMTSESKVSCRKFKTTFAVCGLAPSWISLILKEYLLESVVRRMNKLRLR